MDNDAIVCAECRNPLRWDHCYWRPVGKDDAEAVCDECRGKEDPEAAKPRDESEGA